MPDKYLEELVAAVRADDSDRSDWKAQQDRWKDIRLCKESRTKLPYPGAPDIREPLIDDIVTQLTSTEVSILWSARTLAVFLPRSPEGMKYKRLAEVGFDAMLRQTLQFRGKIENLFDIMNERSFSVAKMIETETDDGTTLPDILPLDPVKVIVPFCTTHIRKAERICHEIILPIREFKAMAKAKGWQNAEKVIARLQQEGKTASGEKVPHGDGEVNSSVPDITLWEIYHYSDAGKRMKTVIARDCPDEKLSSVEWRWPDVPTVTGVDPLTGTPQVVMTPGKERPWPFVQFRYSNRTLRYYDIRGCTEKLESDQRIAAANLNAKAVIMDYTCKPLVKGLNGKTFKWRPGESLPDGAEFIQMPRVDAIFDYNVDMARAGAARRVGAPNGAMSSQDKSRDTKTAREVSQTALQNNLYSSDAIERFAEPLAELFSMMWEWCRQNKPKLSGISGREFLDIPPQVYDFPFIVVSGISGRSANPDLILQQMSTLTQMFGMFPAFGQSIRVGELAKLVFDQIDPKMTDLIVVDPAVAGQAGQAPIEQQVGQIMQLLRGGKNQEGNDEQGLVEQVQEQGKYLAAIAQHDVEDTDTPPEGKVGKPQ